MNNITSIDDYRGIGRTSPPGAFDGYSLQRTELTISMHIPTLQMWINEGPPTTITEAHTWFLRISVPDMVLRGHKLKNGIALKDYINTARADMTERARDAGHDEHLVRHFGIWQVTPDVLP